MSERTLSTLDPKPGDWPVLVTGAAGFVGGHIARSLAEAGHFVRGWVRHKSGVLEADPRIEWYEADLLHPGAALLAVEGMRAVIHTAAWVSLGRDRHGQCQAVNVRATTALLDAACRAGVERFVYTSTLHTVAAGTRDAPATEDSAWNLSIVDSPYARSKREAEARVREAAANGLSTVVLCPGMLLGPCRARPTSTRLPHAMSRSPVVVLPRGGIPIVDAEVMAIAHRRALVRGESGARYALVGPYLSYPELAAHVRDITGWPRLVLAMPDSLHGPIRRFAWLMDRLVPDAEISPTTASGGFLRLHVSGSRADATFGLTHPTPRATIESAFLKSMP